MQLIVNGEPRALLEGFTIARLLDELGLNGRRIAVEVNREIIARERYETRALSEGDQVEIVHFVGGG